MEIQQTSSPELMQFLQDREMQILALAQKNTLEIVQKEMALSDFELLFSANISEKEQKDLTKKSRKLRADSWQELSKKFNGNFQKINEFLDAI